MQIVSKNKIGAKTRISMSNVVRRIESRSKELAIRKFVIATQNIKAVKKMNIQCYELYELVSV